ncbi:hypothetical protein CYMTET_56094 [Cymbomonas tetramitiformis]|uniref:J domain-containing protein n=1 Tax=Cymbomonas tetramitiformis TaxID=36881 RepID=A0AAE0BD29_9CHLO|nr:hypothetical protein CYMTET_56094 [Cymbomonas tetramitiformis]
MLSHELQEDEGQTLVPLEDSLSDESSPRDGENSLASPSAPESPSSPSDDASFPFLLVYITASIVASICVAILLFIRFWRRPMIPQVVNKDLGEEAGNNFKCVKKPALQERGRGKVCETKVPADAPKWKTMLLPGGTTAPCSTPEAGSTRGPANPPAGAAAKDDTRADGAKQPPRAFNGNAAAMAAAAGEMPCEPNAREEQLGGSAREPANVSDSEEFDFDEAELGDGSSEGEEVGTRLEGGGSKLPNDVKPEDYALPGRAPAKDWTGAATLDSKTYKEESLRRQHYEPRGREQPKAPSWYSFTRHSVDAARAESPPAEHRELQPEEEYPVGSIRRDAALAAAAVRKHLYSYQDEEMTRKEVAAEIQQRTHGLDGRHALRAFGVKIESNAGPRELRRAYRVAALMFHPDKGKLVFCGYGVPKELVQR